MTQPQPYQVNNDGYGQAVYAVNEPGPGVVYGQHVNEYGQAAHLVDYPGRGAVPVYFENGPPPGSAQWVAEQTMQQQRQYAAWASGQQQASALRQTQHLLLQL